MLVSSLNALFPVGEAPGYGAAKAAIANLAEALDDFYGCRASPGRPVVFRVAYPGFVATSMAEGYAGPRPFEITARQAAQRILRGVRCGRRRIIFPRRLGSLVLISHLLPRPWLRRLVSAERAYRTG